MKYYLSQEEFLIRCETLLSVIITWNVEVQVSSLVPHVGLK